MTSPLEYHTKGAKQRTVITKLVTKIRVSSTQSYEDRIERSFRVFIINLEKLTYVYFTRTLLFG